MKRIALLLVLLTFCVRAEDEAAAEPAAPKLDTLTLDQCIQKALDNNFAILQAKARVERSQGTIIVARSEALPNVYLSGEFNQVQKSTIPTFEGQSFGTQNDWTTRINLEQPVYAGGRILAGIDIADLQEDVTMLEFQQIVNDVLLVVRERFYNALLSRQQIEVQKQSLVLLEEQLKTTRSKYEAGTLPRFNVLRAEVEVANAKPDLIRAQNNYQLALEDLARLLGMTARPKTKGLPFLVDGVLDQAPYQSDLETCLKTASEQRPEIRALSKRKEIQEKNITVQQAGWLPSLSAYANYGYAKEPFQSSLGQENHGWMVGMKAKVPLFDGLQTYGKVEEAEADLKLAGLQLSDSYLTVDFEVRRAYLALIEATKLIEASRKADEEAKESLRLITARFDVGAATQLEVLDARVALTSAQLNSLQALYDYNVALARLKKATGSDNIYRYNPAN